MSHRLSPQPVSESLVPKAHWLSQRWKVLYPTPWPKECHRQRGAGTCHHPCVRRHDWIWQDSYLIFRFPFGLAALDSLCALSFCSGTWPARNIGKTMILMWLGLLVNTVAGLRSPLHLVQHRRQGQHLAPCLAVAAMTPICVNLALQNTSMVTTKSDGRAGGYWLKPVTISLPIPLLPTPSPPSSLLPLGTPSLSGAHQWRGAGLTGRVQWQALGGLAIPVNCAMSQLSRAPMLKKAPNNRTGDMLCFLHVYTLYISICSHSIL